MEAPKQSLVDLNPKDILPYGETKLLVDEFIWHDPKQGVAGTYVAKERDVQDHFNIFRGVDMVESFAQSTLVAGGLFLALEKSDLSIDELLERYKVVFTSIGDTKFYKQILKGDTIVHLGRLNYFKHKQISFDGIILTPTASLSAQALLETYSTDPSNYKHNHCDYSIVASLSDIKGQAIEYSIDMESENNN